MKYHIQDCEKENKRRFWAGYVTMHIFPKDRKPGDQTVDSQILLREKNGDTFLHRHCFNVYKIADHFYKLGGW